ncbi:HEPN domain-containing protein [Burkholderia sp. Bp9099]|uniref:HEPN domain-containing protein n=1 Tax=Burkholderia sp. Bp9099 TaxID=2184568 RepID=UPI000F5FB615|nr:HEPN domain-containing protein [Burkholderia sp. Bp9099]
MNRQRLLDALSTDLASKSYVALPVSSVPRLHTTGDSQLANAIRDDPEIAALIDKCLNLSASAQPVSIDSFASSLLDHAVRIGVEGAIDALESFLTQDHTPALEILLIAGVRVPEVVEVCEGVMLSPVRDVPSESLIRFFEMRNDWSLQHLVTGNSPFVLIDHRAPVTAIWRKICVRPKWLDAPAFPTENVDPEPKVRLRDICNLLTICGPCSPAPIRHWIEPEDGMLLKEHIGRAWAHPIDQVRVRDEMNLSAEQIDDFVGILTSYLNLDLHVKHAMTVPVQRLNRAIRQTDHIDRALDLGIALEALLLSKDPDRIQLSLQLRLRGAWLLGNTTEERREVFDQLKLIYDARSGAAHTGKIGSNPGEIARRQAAIDQGIIICARAIRKIVERNGFPEWRDILLGADG